MKLLVTGTGRCGTHWFAECLRRAGVPATHEHAFGQTLDGTQRAWKAEVAWPAAAYLPVAGAEVVHLVRHPLDTIASRMARGTFAEVPPSPDQAKLGAWAAARCPLIQEGKTHLERAALHWVGWNQMIDPHADYFLRVEEVVPDDITQLAQVINPNARLDVLPPAIHTSQHPELTWAELATLTRPEVTRRVVELAERYGYR